MSYNKKTSEKKIFELRLNNNIKQNNTESKETKTFSNSNNIKYLSDDRLMTKENIIESKINFKSIFDKIHKNKKKFNNILLSNLEQRQRNMEKIISIDNLLNYIYHSGIPFNIELNKNVKQNNSKDKNNINFELEKIKLGSLDYFNLETYGKNDISKHIMNRMNEEHLLKSKNFKSRKSGIPQEISVYTAKTILKRFSIIKDNTKSKLFDYEKKYNSKISDSVKSEHHTKNRSILKNSNNNYKSKIFYTISKLNSKNSKSTKSVRFNDLKKELDLPQELLANTESKKIIKSQEFNNIVFTENEKSLTANLITSENTKRNMSETTDRQESNKQINQIKPKKNLKKLLFDINMNDSRNNIDDNLKKFKLSYSDLYRYNNNRNLYSKTIEYNDSDYYIKEEKYYKEKEKLKKVSKNFRETNKKIRTFINDYSNVMNRRSFTERNKKENVKMIKMFSSLGKKTISNMATDLGICQNHIQNKLIDCIDDNLTIRRSFKQLDPTLEIILDKKIKKEYNNPYEHNTVRDIYDFIKDRQLKDYQKKEIDRLGELIGKINNKVAFDLSSYLLLYNKNMGNKIEGIQNEKKRKEREHNLKYIKNSIETQIYNLKKIKQRNIFDYNKIVHRFNDYYTKLKNEKTLNKEYRKLLGLNE